MDTNEKSIIMHETAQQLIDMIQKRMNNRLNALNSLQNSTIESVPDDVKKIRELESAVIRGVMQEQSDLIEIIKILFPKVSLKKGTKTK